MQTETERRRHDAVVQQSIENGLRSYMYACNYASIEDFLRLRALTEVKVTPYGRVVDNTLLSFFVTVGFPCEGMARDRSSHRLNVIFGAVAPQWKCRPSAAGGFITSHSGGTPVSRG